MGRIRDEHRRLRPRCFISAATARSESSVLWASSSPKIAPSGTSWLSAYSAGDGRLGGAVAGQLAARDHERIARSRTSTGSPRGRGEPRTRATAARRTAPPRGRRSRRRAAARPGRPAARSGRPRRPSTTATARPETMNSRTRSPRLDRGQAPWHFLYFCPDPHQHGSLRPIRAPDGVKPWPTPPAAARVTRRLAGPRAWGRTAGRPWASSPVAGARRRRRRAPRGPPRAGPKRRQTVGAVRRRSSARRTVPRTDGRCRGAVTAAPAVRDRQRHRLRLAPHGHPEDRRGDLAVDEPAQLLVQLVRLARNSFSGSCWA